MRKSLFFILLATAAVPALAAGPTQDREDRRAARAAERSERSDGEAQRPQPAARPERAQAPSVQRAERAERVRPQRLERSQQIVQSSDQSDRRNLNVSGRRNRPAPVATRDSKGSVTDWRSRERRATRERRVSDATTPTVPTTTGSTISRYGDSDGHRWSSDWRRDNRYDWRRHRSRYSSLYRLGRYYDPFGYGYRRWSIGLFLGSGYYGDNYWLNDPWQYRLPPAYGPYRWVRYYDDALLVNIYSGEVVDVIYGFFW